jgi:hypothetical protein
MPILDYTYGISPVAFPDRPYPTGGVFAAYIICYLPDDPGRRLKRRLNLHRQLRWWRQMTDIPVHVFASNWTQLGLASDPELALLAQHGGSITVVPSQPIILNRIACLSAFYASGYPWGIIMDDDAVLYDGPAYNSGGAFFSEMARNAQASYADVDVFFPINPAKRPGQNQIWAKAPALYTANHVFEANYDLKGSMFMVRNFRLDGRPQILPPASHLLHGEDTLFAIEAIHNGCTVFRCGNIVLKELQGASHFCHTTASIRAGNVAIAAMYAAQGLRLNTKPKRTHLLDRSTMFAGYLDGRPKTVIVTKP